MAVLPNENISITGTSPRTLSNASALVSLAVLYFMMGFITCLNDTLVPYFKAGFNLSYTASSLVQFYFFLTYGIMSIPSGKLVERIGYRNGMVTGFIIAAAGAFLFYPASVFHQYWLFLAALFVLATGIVLLQVSANPYITVLGPAETASSRFTLIQGIGSLGTTIAPVFGAAFILSELDSATDSSAAVRVPYLALAACLIVIAIVLLKLRLPDIRTDRTVVGHSIGGKPISVFSFRNLNLGMIAIFVYVGAEVAIGTFLTGYISDKIQVSDALANRYVAFYWGGMLVGRLIGAVLLRSIRPSLMLGALSLLSIVLIGVSIFTNGYLSVWTMIAVGICNSVMFAVIFSLSVKGLGQYTTIASGFLSTAILGGSIISFAVGVLKDNYSWTVAMLLPIGCYLYIVFFGWYGFRSGHGVSRTTADKQKFY